MKALCSVLPIAIGLAACGAKELPPSRIVQVPVVVDLSLARCPKVSPEVRQAFSSKVKVPPPPITKDGNRAWHDAKDRALDAKDAAGQSLLRDYETCRGSDPA